MNLPETFLIPIKPRRGPITAAKKTKGKRKGEKKFKSQKA